MTVAAEGKYGSSRRAFVAQAAGAVAGSMIAASGDAGARAPSPTHLYVALGDSTGVGVGARGGGYVARLFARLAAERPGSRLVNLCGSGATTRDALEEQAPHVRREATLVTIGIGINDVSRGLPPAQFGERFAALVGKVQERTSAPIVVCNVPDIALAPAVPRGLQAFATQQARGFNAEIAAVAARRRLVLFDAFAMSRDVLPQASEFFSSDGFHPSDSGYELWATRLWPTFERVAGLL